MKQFFFAQKAFIVHDGRLLLVQKSAADPNQPGLWEVPGGRMSFGEDIDPHILREVQEEVGIDIVPGPPFFVWQWQLQRASSSGEPVEMQIVAVARICTARSTTVSYSNRVADDFLGEARWVPLAQLPEYQMIGNMKPVIEAFLALMKGQGSTVSAC